jgi:hypothetical protein
MDSDCHPRNGLEIQFFGLQRSGNHAVLAWLFQQFDDPVYFFNFVSPFKDPFTNYHFTRLPNTVPTPRKRIRGAALTEDMKQSRSRELEGLRLANKQVLAISYENLRLTRLRRKKELVKDRDEVLGTSGKMVRMLLLRDFYNWIASRVRQWENGGANPRINDNVSLWLIYAKEFVGETAYLGGRNVMTIAYNRWVKDELYRSEILDDLGISVKDNSNSFVPGIGGGSSFDGRRFSGKPEEMEIEERWRYLLQDRFSEVVSAIGRRKEEIDHYNQRVFDLAPPI